jgi:hypothetical protein
MPQRLAPNKAPLEGHRQEACEGTDQRRAWVESALLFAALHAIPELGVGGFGRPGCPGRAPIVRCLRSAPERWICWWRHTFLGERPTA